MQANERRRERIGRELKLLDLSARLPYGVKVKCTDTDEVGTAVSVDVKHKMVGVEFPDGTETKFYIDDVKCCLRSFSSMDYEEQYACEFAKYNIPSYIADVLYMRYIDFRNFIDLGLAVESDDKILSMYEKEYKRHLETFLLQEQYKHDLQD